MIPSGSLLFVYVLQLGGNMRSRAFWKIPWHILMCTDTVHTSGLLQIRLIYSAAGVIGAKDTHQALKNARKIKPNRRRLLLTAAGLLEFDKLGTNGNRIISPKTAVSSGK
ncbi:unnamed protein product [Calicophoron daubneyi]|uniref:Uncharacterized protein n=1 Tax=Calicophoron daubneyi TaxID=300641 RepID=A0AAV2TD81_CALDB